MMHCCPRCRAPLEPGEYFEYDVDFCEACDGILLRQRDLMGLLEKLVKLLRESHDLDSPIVPVVDKGADVHCPHCGTVMQHYGYMERKEVEIDSCLACGLIWLDSNELDAMCLMFAQSQQRSTDLRQKTEEACAELRQRTYKKLLARARANRRWSASLGDNC